MMNDIIENRNSFTLRKLIESCDIMVIEGVEVDSVRFNSTGSEGTVSQFLMADETRISFADDHIVTLVDGKADFFGALYEFGNDSALPKKMSIEFFRRTKLTAAEVNL